MATAGKHLAERTYMLALGATMVATVVVSLRGPAWLEALRLGRLIEQRRLAAANPPPRRVTAPERTDDLSTRRNRRDQAS